MWRGLVEETVTDSHQTQPVIDHSGVAEEINAQIRYTDWAVFKKVGTGQVTAEQLAALEAALAATGATIRGWYDVAAFRADADLMVWWWAESTDTLQEAWHILRNSALGEQLDPVWSAMAIHRPAEFNRSHIPAFLAGETPKEYISIYPFVRSYEWYLLPDAERSTLLREHGAAARGYGDVLANTVAAFALGDYEWMLAFEADQLYRIVDLMRDLRATEARLHVREEIPFYTGKRVALANWVKAVNALS